MLEESPFSAAMQVLRDPTFADVAREAIRDYVSWGDLASRPVPEGLTRLQLWEALSAIRRFGATPSPVSFARGEHLWYTLTVEGRQCLRTIERHCGSDSRLHQMVQRRTGQRFLVSSRIQEAIATCQTDGVEADTAELERMLQQGRAPRTPEARLVKNAYEMLGELPSYIDEEFSPELLKHLFERTTHGVHLGELERVRTDQRGVPPVFQQLLKAHRPPHMGPAGTPADDAEALQQICDYANGRTGDPRESVAVRGYMLLAAVGYWRPVPDFNATVARHMLRLLYVKNDYPVLGYLPTSAMARKWALGQMEPGAVRYSLIEPGMETEDGVDATAEILVYLQLTVAAINDLQSRIQSTKEEDEALGRTLRAAERLNYRQRDLLSRALRRPDAEFTLREHRLDHRTAYSTARADLLELVELGFLKQETRGLTFVFSPAPDLRDRLGRAQADAE